VPWSAGILPVVVAQERDPPAQSCEWTVRAPEMAFRTVILQSDEQTLFFVFIGFFACILERFLV
jgi:hypothetical protein